MRESTYLIFGDLHGRILPAFRLAQSWARENGIPVEGLLQVGDLGYFPDPTRLDKATVRHAAADPMELGAQLVTGRNAEADRILAAQETATGSLWFTAGNHEDFDALADLGRVNSQGHSFPVDAYGRVRCIRDGAVEILSDSLRVGAIWGIDDQITSVKKRTPKAGRIQANSVAKLAHLRFDILLSHDGPRDAVLQGSGSEGIDLLLDRVRPPFAFFGHYGSRFGRIVSTKGRTEVYQMAGFELRRDSACAERGSVGRLVWDGEAGRFEYLDEAWLRSFTRHNWTYR